MAERVHCMRRRDQRVHRQLDAVAIKQDFAEGVAVAIQLPRFDLPVFPEDQIRRMLSRPLPEAHLLFWRIDTRQANLVLPQVGIEQGHRVAAADVDNAGT